MHRLSLFPIILVMSCATVPSKPTVPPQAPITQRQARTKLSSISTNKVQLWVVTHVRAHRHLDANGKVEENSLIAGTLKDADAVVQGGGDAIVLINSKAKLDVYERVIAAVRERYPNFPLAISALDYGPKNLTEGFRLAKKFKAQVVWCEVAPDEPFEYESDDGKYVKGETTERNFALKHQKDVLPTAMHVAGVHMKYTKPLNELTFPQAIKAALGSVDGINVTGPKTGVVADIERIKQAHQAASGYPLGLASGVSVDNIEPVLPFIDYVIVGTSLKEDDNDLRTSREKVWALRSMISELGYGTDGAQAPRTMEEMHGDDESNHQHHNHSHGDHKHHH